MLNSYNSSMYIFNDTSFNARYFIIDIDGSIIALTTLVNNSPVETTTLLIMRPITWKSMEDSRDYSSWGCRVERSAYILETDVAVRHVLEMIVRVITWRYWRPRPRAILRSDASSRRRQFAYRRSRNLLLKNAYGKPPSPQNRANNFDARPRKFCRTGNPSFIARDARYHTTHTYACANIRALAIMPSGTQYANRNSSLGRNCFRLTRALDRFYSPLFPYGWCLIDGHYLQS